MSDQHQHEIEKRLSDIPTGKTVVKTHLSELEIPFQWEDMDSWSEGKGLIENWPIFPGVSLMYGLYCADCYTVHHPPHHSVMQINHCRYGRIGWEMHDGINIYLGPGDLSLHTMDVCAEAVMNFPLGCYEGIAVTVDFEMLEQHMPDVLQEAGIQGHQFYSKFCAHGSHTAISASPQIDHIFSELYTLPAYLQIPYFKLKVQELLLFLSMLEPEKEKRLDQYRSQQIEIIQAVHRQLTEHLDKRFTIDELSKQYLINTTTLKSIFKSVYGAPIAAYMKEYRIRQASRLLRETNLSIAQIAVQVGYENQSKFTSAFRSILHLPPAAYRKQSKLS